MQYKITVKPKSGERVSWHLEYSHFFNPPYGHGPLYQVSDWDVKKGVFTGTVFLPEGKNCLFFTLGLGVEELVVDMPDGPKITQGTQRTWPVTLKTDQPEDYAQIVVNAAPAP
jgi:hypothetical protein